jgi:uncharacterized protein (UPF0332 family)
MTRHPERLLAQALHLAKRDRFRPEQVNLRRAVSSAYYALFHALIGAACAQLAGPGTRARAMRMVLARTFTHAEMQRASRAFAQGQNGLPRDLRPVLAGGEISGSLRELAQLFHRLQDDRHEADYDLTVRWRRGDVLVQITAVESSLGYLRRERSAPDLRAYLTSILVWNRISNR